MPAIVLLYLWDAGWKEGKVGQSAFTAQIPVVDHYRRAGLRIATVNVGGALTCTKNKSHADRCVEVLDDGHHPNCAGMHIISAMLRRVIYADLYDTISHPTSQLTSQLSPTRFMASDGASSLDGQSIDEDVRPFSRRESDAGGVLGALLGDVDVGSLMQFTPQAGSSNLEVEQTADVRAAIEVEENSVAYANRADRKLAYTLPRCPTPLSFVINEPELEWLGVGYGGGYYAFHTYSGAVNVTLNGMPLHAELDPSSGDSFFSLFPPYHPVPKSELQRATGRRFDLWMRVPRNHTHTVTFCSTSTQMMGDWGKGHAQLNWLVGVRGATEAGRAKATGRSWAIDHGPGQHALRKARTRTHQGVLRPEFVHSQQPLEG